METQVRTPHAVFMMPQRLLVPLFQRPYVWNEERQWEPLWRDVTRVAERLLNDPIGQHQPHFLGAVVLQQVQNQAGDLQQRTVIDGQQRLTTLQIMIDAIQGEISLLDAGASAARLEQLVENGKPFQRTAEDRFKIWPTNKDRDAFNEVMASPYPIKYSNLSHKDHRLVQAHEYFSENCKEWLNEGGAKGALKRAEVLERSVRELLQMVVIDLAPQENAQEIFETLNARGAILTAADLIKNFIFQRLLEQGADVEKAYAKYWQNFETSFWEEEVSVGRVKFQRSSLFINQWLISKTGEEVLAREVFSRFKAYADFESGISMPDLLESIHSASIVYKTFSDMSLNQESDISATGLFAYRLKVLDSEAARPLVMFLMDPVEGIQDLKTLENCLSIIESWLVRRMLVRATTKRYNKIFPELIQLLRKSRIAKDITLQNYLGSQSVDSSYWPDDAELKSALVDEKIYGNIHQGRVRMVFETIEDHLRGWVDGKESKAGTRIKRSKYAIEHVMPQSWQKNWPLPTDVSEYDRDKTIQKLGNLTLLTSKLNSSVSNSGWFEKKQAFNEHDLLQLNNRLLAEGGDSWTDEKIIERTELLANLILTIWKVPPGHHNRKHEEIKRWSSKVTVADLLTAGYVEAGQRIYPRIPKYAGRHGIILPDGRIEVEGQIRDSLSLAGGLIHTRNPNGWWFWVVDPKTRRTMNDVRQDYEVAMGIERVEDESDEFTDQEDL